MSWSSTPSRAGPTSFGARAISEEKPLFLECDEMPLSSLASRARRATALFVAFLLLPAVSGAEVGGGDPRTDWLRDAGYGVFVHFLPGDAGDLARVQDFDVEALARQLESVGAGYLILTLGQNSGFFNAPNSSYGETTGYVPGERCATRDLPSDLHRVLEPRGIRLMLYLPCQAPNGDRRAQRAFGLPEGPEDQPIDLEFARRWAEVIEEWSVRYGDHVAGWWFDGGYEWVGFNEDIARIYAGAARRGNPHAIVTFNPGIGLRRWTRAESYTAGELVDPFDVLPTSRWLEGSQWHALTYLGSRWSARDTRHPSPRWAEWVRAVTAREGAVTLDLGPNWDPQAGPIGSLADAQLEQVAAVREAVSTTFAHVAVRTVPDDLRRELDLAPFYQKNVMVGALALVGSAQLSDAALREAAWIVGHMLPGRDDILKSMADQGVRLAVMAWNEFTTDLPEHRHLEPAVYWDRRARGLGATPEAPAVSGAEENLLGFPGDPYAAENILIHELAHAIHATGMNQVDPTFEKRLQAAYESAMEGGRWAGTYAATDASEYWAEGVQSWFDDNRENDSLHNEVNTRAELRAYDPALAALCAEVFGEGEWRYVKPVDRGPAGRAHLGAYDPAMAPRFRWREYPITDAPRVQIDTARGSLTVELDALRAPITTKNFLRYVLEGYYSDGEFFRTVTAANQPDDPVRIAVVQAGADPSKEDEEYPPIPLERTRDTGLRHRDGTISMARLGPDTATQSFFICVGDQPELDFEGKRNPDGQGFAAFGRVVAGMELVRAIHALPADGQKLDPPVPIQRAVRVH
jgi:cyclophilin family peptidyl-prolyl cis-trans isomerase